MCKSTNLVQCRIADLECQVTEDQSFSDKLCRELEEQKEVINNWSHGGSTFDYVILSADI